MSWGWPPCRTSSSLCSGVLVATSLGKKTCFDLQEAVSHTAADMSGNVLRAAGVKMSNGKWESSVSMETSIKVWTPNRAGCVAGGCFHSGKRKTDWMMFTVRLLVIKPRSKFCLVATGKKWTRSCQWTHKISWRRSNWVSCLQRSSDLNA